MSSILWLHHFAAIERYLLEFVMIFAFFVRPSFHLFPENILFLFLKKICPFYFLMKLQQKKLLNLLQLCQFFVIRSFHVTLHPSSCHPFFLTGPFEDPQIAKEKRIAIAKNIRKT